MPYRHDDDERPPHHESELPDPDKYVTAKEKLDLSKEVLADYLKNLAGDKLIGGYNAQGVADLVVTLIYDAAVMSAKEEAYDKSIID